MNIPPHIEWLRETEKNLDELCGRNQHLINLRKEVENGVTLEFMNKHKTLSEEETELIFNVDLMTPIKNSQEILVRNIPSLNGVDTGILARKIKIPFEDVILTIMKKNEYEPYFIQFFKTLEGILDRKTGEIFPMYVVKTMRKEKSKRNPFGMEHDYSAASELIFTPKKLPRVWIPSYVQKSCQTCNHVTMTDFMNDKNCGFFYCMKTPRTVRNCLTLKSNEYTYSGFCISSLLTVLGIFEKFNSQPQKISRISNQIRKNPNQINIQNPEERHYIEITDTKFTYVSPRKPHQGGTHASPCEHIRREHFRTLKSGKRIPVKQTISGKGNKKPIYVLK